MAQAGGGAGSVWRQPGNIDISNVQCYVIKFFVQYHLVIKLNDVVIKEIYQSDARNWNTRFFASFGPGDPPADAKIRNFKLVS